MAILGLLPDWAIEMLKKIAEGHRTQVQIKNKRHSWSNHVPVVVTTNDQLWRHASSTEPALRSRFYSYENMKMAKKKWLVKKKLNPKVWQYLYETTKPTSPNCSDDDAQFSDDDCRTPVVFTLKKPKKKEDSKVHPVVEIIDFIEQDFQPLIQNTDSLDVIDQIVPQENIKENTPNRESFFVNLRCEEDIRYCEEKLQQDLE